MGNGLISSWQLIQGLLYVCLLNTVPSMQHRGRRACPAGHRVHTPTSSILSRPFLASHISASTVCLPKGHWAGQSPQAPLKPRETARRELLMNFKTTDAGDLESIRFYYLFIKKSVTDNSVKGYKRCSRPTQPEERTWGWVGGGWRRGPSQLGTLGSGGEGFRK